MNYPTAKDCVLNNLECEKLYAKVALDKAKELLRENCDRWDKHLYEEHKLWLREAEKHFIKAEALQEAICYMEKIELSFKRV